ncbi:MULTISPECIES: hypothetical protein [Pseudomonas]|uniref:hypothetical protein n=1 Tax=Pseudomonas TaxID=286 RepID=UPI0018E7AD10|nr:MULTISPECIES: hypothetical protein [Pseudomonas]MBJ2215979.1 hypothetical protein [Pseudomonas carnis]MBP5948022.1 hypothetical protein [Pseudomonas sp. P9(2020)]
MVVSQYMPRYGSKEHRRLGVMLLALFVSAIAILMPDIALAAFTGDFAPNETIVTNTNSSASKWWKVLSFWGLYGGIGWLIVSILAFNGKYWACPFLIALAALFGEPFINGVKALMA